MFDVAGDEIMPPHPWREGDTASYDLLRDCLGQVLEIFQKTVVER